MRRGMQGHVAGVRKPTWGAGGAQGTDAWRGPRESTQTPGLHHVATGLAGKGPTGDVAASRASDPIARCRSRGPESTRSQSKHVRQRRFK